MNDRRTVKIFIGEGTQNYKLEILNSGVCSGILPVSIIQSDYNILAVYNIDGYQKLANLSDLSAANVLSILSLLIQTLEACKDYLIFPDEYTIDVDTIYIDYGMKQVKLMYIPTIEREFEERRETVNVHNPVHISQQSQEWEIQQIKKVAEQLKKQSSTGAELYLETLENMLCKEGMRSAAVLGLIESLKEEARLCLV